MSDLDDLEEIATSSKGDRGPNRNPYHVKAMANHLANVHDRRSTFVNKAGVGGKNQKRADTRLRKF